MIIENYRNIVSGQDIKLNLQQLKNSLKNTERSEIPEEIKNSPDVFLRLLNDTDPKVRQHSAAILGIIGADGSMDALYDAYISDETLYNKAPYVEAMAGLNHSAFDDRLMDRREALISGEYPPEAVKHITAEIHELTFLLRDRFPKHEFTGWDLENEFVLLTNRNFKSVTASQLQNIRNREFTAGVMVKTSKLRSVIPVRTYSELLFVPDGIRTCSSDASQAAEELAAADIAGYILGRLSNPASPVFFRTEYRTKDRERSAPFERKLSALTEQLSGYRLINSTGDYEVELRFIDTSDNRLIVLIRFCNIPDDRFSYRRQVLPVSLKPSAAALVMQLSKEYFTPDACVLDPFVGSGIMLAEREAVMPAARYYGVDIFGGAIKAATENLAAAGLSSKTELITKDILEFEHKYLFDEIVTDMPFVTEKKSAADIEALYQAFFKKAVKLLKPHGKAFVYSRNRDFLRKYSTQADFSIVSEYEINRVEGSYFYILSL